MAKPWAMPSFPLVAVLFAAVLVASCGSSGATGTASLASRYGSLAASANASLCQMYAAAAAQGTYGSFAAVPALVDPSVQELGTFTQQLSTFDWPADMKTDAVALQNAGAAWGADLSEFAYQNSSTFPSFINNAAVDSRKMTGAANTLRHDLGLPPTPAGGPTCNLV